LTGSRFRPLQESPFLEDRTGPYLRYVQPYAVGVLCAALGKENEALRWLETAWLGHDALMVCLKTDPRFDNLRSDPRLQDLLRRMNFPA